MEIWLPIRYNKPAQINETTIYIGSSINSFCEHSPYLIAEKIGAAILSGQTLPSIIQTCISDLESLYPYYKMLLGSLDPASKENYVKHFIAGACGFYNLYISETFKIDPLIEFLRDNEFLESFERCRKEPMIGNTAGTITDDPYFGDYAVSYRTMQQIFQGATKKDKNNKNKLVANILLSFIANNSSTEEINRCTLPYIKKNPNERPGLFDEFSKYYLTLNETQTNENIKCNSLYDAIRQEIEHIVFGMDIHRYQVFQCEICEKFYIETNGNNDFYCTDKCKNIGAFWKLKVYKCRDALRNRVKSETAYIEELKAVFKYQNIVAQIRRCIAEPTKPIYFHWFFALVISAFYEKSESPPASPVYTDRDQLVRFLCGGESLWDYYKNTIPNYIELKNIFSNRDLSRDTNNVIKHAHKLIYSEEFRNYLLYL